VAAAKYLQTVEYVEPSKVGIWGWSYGGFMAGMSIANGTSTFLYGISVAPVTDWRFYGIVSNITSC
jgi:dipeptidyl-peptidase-4